MNSKIENVFKDNLPFWNDLDKTDREYICKNTSTVTFSKGTNAHDNSECSGVFFVRSGCLRVYIMSEDGKDITLYRLYEGDMCMLSASCVLQSITFDVFITAEEDSECIIISGTAFASITDKNPNVKIFSLELAVSRFSDVMWVMQQILFMSVDKRLAIFLIDESNRKNSDTIELTHEQIARYMSSAREVVSRMLKYFSSEGLVEVSRKGIKIINKNRLRNLTL